MEGLKVEEHEHPLTLIDLQVQYQQQEEEEEDDAEKEEEAGEPITKEVFHGVKCKMCREEIHMYHRYYYTCTLGSSCHFSLHKFCGELPKRLDHPLHPHPLTSPRWLWDEYWKCYICQSWHQPEELGGYECYKCTYLIDVQCAVEGGKTIIHHPCHVHVLSCLISKPTLCHCNACGKEHKGMFYQCTTCTNFTIHSECAFLPETLLIQETTDNAFHHSHPLTISYSFPRIDQEARHHPKCRVCGVDFYSTYFLWIYKCDKCMYYVHLHCATSITTEPFMSIFLPPTGLVKNYKDADHPRLLHLPFPDETYSLPKYLFFQQSESGHQVNLNHESHQHPLILVESNGQTSSSNTLVLKCHDPMRKIQLLCNGCLGPITSTMPFYKCTHEDECNNFALHEWCTRLPPKIEKHPAHPQHPLLLGYSQVLPPHFFGVFDCDVCSFPCNGFAYCCVQCEYYIDVTCGLLPKEITHESHPNHLLSLVQLEDDKFCHMCLKYLLEGRLSFHCNSCPNIVIHPECALLLPKTIRHKYDKHPMHLSYLPIENHKVEYFCEICENDLNPHRSFYHCKDCAQSVHAACAPLILQSETQTHSYYQQYGRPVYNFVKIKFGGIHNTDAHPHSLSLAQATVLDGQCSWCEWDLQYKMIFKCLEKCGFVIHYDCCKRLNNI